MDKVLAFTNSKDDTTVLRIIVENKEERRKIHDFCEASDDNLICRTIYKGTIDWKCLNCGYFQGPNTPPKLCSEYDDMAAILGYTQSATLVCSDTYFYCIHCDEHNSYSNATNELIAYRTSGRLRLSNYKSTGSLIISKRSYSGSYKLEWDEALK